MNDPGFRIHWCVQKPLDFIWMHKCNVVIFTISLKETVTYMSVDMTFTQNICICKIHNFTARKLNKKLIFTWFLLLEQFHHQLMILNILFDVNGYFALAYW